MCLTRTLVLLFQFEWNIGTTKNEKFSYTHRRNKIKVLIMKRPKSTRVIRDYTNNL